MGLLRAAPEHPALGETRAATPAERARFERIGRKAGRPKIGQGAKVVAVTLEQGLLKRVDANAEQRGIELLVDVDRWRVTHAGSCINDYGDAGDGFGMQEQTNLKSKRGVVQLPANDIGTGE